MDVDTKPPAKKVKFAIDYNEAIGKSENFSANFCESHTPDFISQITHHLNCLSLQAVPLKSVKAASYMHLIPTFLVNSMFQPGTEDRINFERSLASEPCIVKKQFWELLYAKYAAVPKSDNASGGLD